MRAPLFYDRDNTAFYFDGASTSVLQALQISGYNSASAALLLNWPTSGYIGVFGSVVNSAKVLNFRGNSGDSYRVSTAQLGGAAYINGDDTAGNGSGAVIIAPGGARYATTASTVTGAIKITVPEPVSDVMCTMTIRVYTYDGLSFEITCGGYPYGSYGSNGWVNTFAYMNTQNRAALTVRFGNDGVNACLWIGETGSSWSYPQVAVMDFTTGYYGRDAKHYADGWDISFVSSFNTVYGSQTAYPQLTYTNTGGLTNNSYTTYGGSATTTAPNGYYGLLFGTSTSHSQVMFDGSGNGGFYRQASGWGAYWTPGSSSMGIMSSTTSGSYALYVTGSIYATANITAYSDRRAKKDIETINNALDKTNQLRGVYYRAIEEQVHDTAHHGKRLMGVIAQEVLEVVPEVVTYDKENDKYGVSYANMVGLLIEAVKELSGKVTEQDARIAKLEALVNKLIGE